MIRTIGSMDLIPRGYGAAYAKPCEMRYVIAVIPLNLVIGALYAACGWLMSVSLAWQSPRNRLIKKAYRRGHRKGRGDGYRSRDLEVQRLTVERDYAIKAFDRFADRLRGVDQ